MRFALPLVLLMIVVAGLIFISRDPAVVPEISVNKRDVIDAQPNVDTLHKIYSDRSNRLCIASPEFIEVGSTELGQQISGVAQFSIADSLQEYSRQSGMAVDSLRAITLSVQVSESLVSKTLNFDLAGIESKASVANTGNVALRFPGHLFRNHSIVTVVVRDERGEVLDLAGYSDWLLCGDAFDSPQFEDRQPVSNNVADLELGAGVNVMGAEYACVQGWGLHHHVAAGVSHVELANMLSEWGVRTVRLPLNEHCWLAEQYAFANLKRELSGRYYQDSVAQLVELLTQQYQMHVVLDLHWTGTRDEQARELKPLPNRQFSAEFWRDVANRFGSNNRVVFNLFNESHVPAAQAVQPADGAEANGVVEGGVVEGGAVEDGTVEGAAVDAEEESAAAASVNRARLLDLSAQSALERSAIDNNWWLVWRDGNDQYAGMQSLVDAIRATGARNHISVGGLDYSADQRGWLSYVPHDPLGKMWVDNHAYPAENKCADQVCWGQTLLPLKANGYGIMFGEAGNSIGQHPQGCQTDFVKRVYRFARENSIPVLAWTFVAGGVTDSQSNEPAARNCQIPTLITRWPGEQKNGDLSQNEILDKKAYDPTPENFLDDATWPGCVFYAYANGLPLDDDSLPDRDPAENNPGTTYGNCAAVVR